MAGRTAGIAGRVNRAIEDATRTGLRKGFREGSTFWVVVGTAAIAMRLYRRFGGPGTATVVTERLAPGEAILVTHFAPDGARPR